LSKILPENKESKVRQKMYTRPCYLPKVKFMGVQKIESAEAEGKEIILSKYIFNNIIISVYTL